jgi:hypothetical protein
VQLEERDIRFAGHRFDVGEPCGVPSAAQELETVDKLVPVHFFNRQLLEGPVIVQSENRDHGLAAREAPQDGPPVSVDLYSRTIAAHVMKQLIYPSLDRPEHVIRCRRNSFVPGEPRQQFRQRAAPCEPQKQLELV